MSSATSLSVVFSEMLLDFKMETSRHPSESWVGVGIDAAQEGTSNRLQIYSITTESMPRKLYAIVQSKKARRAIISDLEVIMANAAVSCFQRTRFWRLAAAFLQEACHSNIVR